jgi:hypothetical protein
LVDKDKGWNKEWRMVKVLSIVIMPEWYSMERKGEFVLAALGLSGLERARGDGMETRGIDLRENTVVRGYRRISLLETKGIHNK